MAGKDYRIGSLVEYVPFASIAGEPRTVRVTEKFQPLGNGGPWFTALTTGRPQVSVWAYDAQITEVILY